MANVKVFNVEGSEVDSMELADSVFAVEINEHLVHMASVRQLANKRQGTQSAKTRAEVRGGGRKPWRQKGTGQARHGSIRSPIWKGGGVIFAPKPRDYSFKMNRKEKALALKSVLTSRVNEGKLIILDEINFEEVKTKQVKSMLGSFDLDRALIVLGEKNEKVDLSARNIPKVRTVLSNSISVYDILKYDTVIVTKDAVKKIEEVYA